MDIRNALQALTTYLPLEVLLRKVDTPMQYLPEEVTSIIPSIILGNDGLRLARLLLVTDRFLCEVEIPGPPSHAHFDFVEKASIKNYRVRTWTQEIKEGDAVKASYEIAEVLLFHHPPADFRTELAYAGQERTAWLRNVVDGIPISLVLGAHR